MLVFNEGVPRAGKSYDAVLTHILPSVVAGRRVFARLNGLDHEKIATYLQLPVELVRSLLVLVTTADVPSLFVACRSDDGSWVIADDLKDSLVVIDECHEFYVAGRNAIDPALEQFFALCGQNGIDCLLISQFYRRLHSSIRARVERKNVFQKLTAVKLEGKYLVKRYHTVAPDKFELVDTQILTYKPELFPLYSGYAPGAGNVDVYKQGGSTVWKNLAKPAIIVVPAALFGIWYLYHLVSTGGRGLVHQHAASAVVHSPQSQLHSSPVSGAAAGVVRAVSGSSLHQHVDDKGMPDEVKYVFDLANDARPHLDAVLDWPGKPVSGVIEWVQDSGTVLDRMSFDQLRDMGVTIEARRGWALLRWRDRELVVTSWPLPPVAPASSGTSAVSPTPVVASDVPVASGAGAWKSSPMRGDYVPPEIAKRPDYAPHILSKG